MQNPSGKYRLSYLSFISHLILSELDSVSYKKDFSLSEPFGSIFTLKLSPISGFSPKLPR